ncbi:MAG: L-lactate dehydrogenase [Clostridium sp.]|nr:L-lactate dehydrogenase [Clostridium sp.]
MNLKSRKVAIIGTGLVGSSIAFSLVNQGICDEILMIDINTEKAKGEVLDLSDSMEYLNKYTNVRLGQYEDCKYVDIVIITASAPQGKIESRLEILETSAKITKSIVKPVINSGFNGKFIIVSNPVDVISYYVKELSGLPKNKVIGTGTALDSARLKKFIGELINVDPRSVQAYSMGEHGDSQMIPWSHVFVGGKSFNKVILDNENRFGKVNFDEFVTKTVKAGWEIYNRKGTTYYGIAATVAYIVKAILDDENKIIPVSAYLDGEYGQYDLYAGVPAVINHEGIKEIVEIDLNEDEKDKFEKSCLVIKKYINKLK